MNNIEEVFPKEILTQLMNASPYTKFLEIVVAGVSTSSVKLKININRWREKKNQDGFVNFGYLYGVVDTAAWLSIINTLGKYQHAVTLSMHINHLDKNLSEDNIFVEAQCIKIQDKHVYTFVEIFQKNKKILANANVNFILKTMISSRSD